MTKDPDTKQEQRKARKKYLPMLARMQQNTPREKWQEAAPRLTQEEYDKIQEITHKTYSRFQKTPVTRNNFLWIHEKMENELDEQILMEMGLIAGLEWKGHLFPQSIQVFSVFLAARGGTSGIIEGILPTPEFIESSIFDHIQTFYPTLVLFQHEDYERFMHSAEQAVQDAERRRDSGDEYFTERDKAINYRPKGDTDNQPNSGLWIPGQD